MREGIAIDRRLMISLILLIGILGPLAIDEYTPSLPAMAKGLKTSASSIQLTVTLFFASFSIAQILIGPISDRFGRKKVLQTCIGIFLAGTLICIFAPNLGLVYLGRMIQGLGIASAPTIRNALIIDAFEGEDIKRVTGYFSLTYGLVPIIAPVIGGYIQDWLDWRANFAFMFLFAALVSLLLWALLPETLKRSARVSIHPIHLAKAYGAVLSHGHYLFAIAGAMFSWATIITFVLVAPFLIQTLLGFSATVYGYIALLVGVGFFLGNVINTRLASKLSSNTLITIGLILITTGAITFLVILLFHFFNLWLISLFSFVVMSGVGLTFPNYYGRAIGVFTKKHVGVASSLVPALIAMGIVIYSYGLTHLHAHNPLTLGILYSLLALANIAAYVFFRIT